ncbi:MAG: succinate dehydrogenase [Candidatus Latescibacteria bacterium]|nr:succinate dehydrogenase [Candidatus Latescibacterota bacterium]NIO28440.1 succinate dehydrogenase [Candidatus Latescibacterota bacterium]NIO55989.1 succinate dehydrogenase [Candidatus Latescibacterota bacterium]NIT01953.1 succinate dehydrogenase [Candidatus Latescibacterota bacterium]
MNALPLDRHFALRKLHSLTGIIPIGVFLCFHLFENSLATKGSEYYTEHVVHKIGNIPYVELLEIFFIAVPILFHGIYGLIIWLQGRSNVLTYGYFRNWMYWVQRYTGIIALIFIFTHVWGTRIQVLINEAVTKDNLFHHLATQLENPLYLTWYIIGNLAAVIHLANGISLALITWGITIGRRSQTISTWVCAFIGLILLLLSAQALRGLLATGV